MSKTFLSAALITALAVSIEDVEVAPDQFIAIREMSSGAREEFEQCLAVKGSTQIRATLFSLTACDENGELLFTEKDIPALQSLPSSVSIKVYEAAMIMNGLKTDAVDKAEQD